MSQNSTKVSNPREHARLLREQALQLLEEPSTDFEASWLLQGGIGSHTWLVHIPGESPIELSFSHLLPDKTNLIELENSKLLTTIQHFAFNMRSGYVSTDIGPNRWLECVAWVTNLASYLTLHTEIYDVKNYGFGQLDKNGCEVLLEDISLGSWGRALLHQERILDIFHEAVSGTKAPVDMIENPFLLSEEFISSVVNYLQLNQLYTDSNLNQGATSTGLVSRTFLAELLGCHPSAFQHLNMRAFLRQFEPTLKHEYLLLEANRRGANHASHKTALVADTLEHTIGVKAFTNHVIILKHFLSAHSSFPDEIPKVCIDEKDLSLGNRARLRKAGHTEKIPLTTGIRGISASIKWVMVYGDALVDSIIYYTQQSLRINMDGSPYSHKHRAKHKDFLTTIDNFMSTPYEELPSFPLGAALHITTLNPQSRSSDPAEGVSFIHVMQSFIGACTVMIASMKPMREGEISSLERICLDIDTVDGGAFMTHENKKSGSMGLNDDIRRPIPYVTARAIQLLQRLGTALTKIYGDDSEYASKLFYFPSAVGFTKPSGKGLDFRIDKCVKAFCDQISLPIDKFGRRWYIRKHELRKFFIITMHQHAEMSSNEALRHQAGHLAFDSLGKYLAGELPRDEICQYEAECIDEKLIKLEQGLLNRNENSGLAALYDDVSKMFGVRSVKSRNKRQYFNLLQKLLYAKDIMIITYTIHAENFDGEVWDTDIAIKYGNKSDEKF
ncbi:hypothetical protein [Pseudomonas sp. DSP3-2-2]|uniref:hypothetical protein n=1 Tax=unclassified Pseudomonas TaxID=196821 RepID=UPI003CF013AF